MSNDMNLSSWCTTQTPSVIGNGFAMPASGRDRHAVAAKQSPGTPVWSPPT